MGEYKIVTCPACGKENHLDADSVIDESTCEFCHAPLQPDPVQNDQPVVVSQPPPPPPKMQYIDPDTLPYSNARPFWYVALMIMMTFGIYQIVWFYRAWKVLLKQYQLKGNAVVNTIFAPFCLWSFFRYAFNFGEKGGFTSSWKSNMSASLYFLFIVIYYILEYVSDKIGESQPFEGAILSLLQLTMLALALIPLRDGILAMNAGYAVVQPGTRMHTTLSPWSITFVVIGSITWLLLIIGLLVALNHINLNTIE